MSFESTVLLTLQGNSALTALVPAPKIFFGKVPQGTGFPFIGCFRVSTRPTNCTTLGTPGESRLDNIVLQVTVYCETEARALAAADAVRTCLERSAPTVFFMTDQQTTFDDPTELQGQILTFSAWHPSTAPAS
mgnify:CR=1 FL=1